MENFITEETTDERAFGGKDDLPEPETNELGQEEATEDEQLDNDLIVTRARKMMFGKGRDNILKMLGSSESPAQGIGKVSAMLVRSLVQAAKAGGRNISEEAALNAGFEIGEDLNDLGKANGVFEYDSEEDELRELQDASLWGVKFYGDEQLANNEITPEMQQAATQQMQEGIATEKGSKMKRNPVAAGVKEAVSGNTHNNKSIVNSAKSGDY